MSRSLPKKMVAKPWGQDRLPHPFSAPSGERIGEIWFAPPHAIPQLLVKYLFTSEALSVQVHPSDAQAPDGSRGKEECWLVLSAEPGGRLAVGFREEVSQERMHAAALDGSIEGLLDWRAVTAGDFIYLPAGTVHAIGAGLTLVEVQQNSDVTYRLYDYGRPRELHLDAGVAVADGGIHDCRLRRSVPEDGSVTLVDGPRFRLDRLAGSPDAATHSRYGAYPLLVIPLDEPVTIAHETIAPGDCGLANNLEMIQFHGGKSLITQPL